MTRWLGNDRWNGVGRGAGPLGHRDPSDLAGEARDIRRR